MATLIPIIQRAEQPAESDLPEELLVRLEQTARKEGLTLDQAIVHLLHAKLVEEGMLSDEDE